MRYVFMLLFVTINLMAQETAENWATIRLICQDDTHYHVEVEAIGATDTVILGLDIEDAIQWNVGSEKTARFSVLLGNTSVSLTVYANGGAFFADSLILSETVACGNDLAFETFLRQRMREMER